MITLQLKKSVHYLADYYYVFFFLKSCSNNILMIPGSTFEGLLGCNSRPVNVIAHDIHSRANNL
jgi:hypothetical protein